jgi:hypothetical protein
MRQMALSESVKKRERPHAFVRHSTATFKRICAAALARVSRSPSEKKFIPEFPITARRREAPCHAWIGPRAHLGHSNRSGNKTGVYRR